MRRSTVDFGVNEEGRDLVVGDVHGCFRTLERALAALDFRPGQDRLFSVGDLVERGPHSEEAIEWIEQRFAGVTRGNHEQGALGWLADRISGSEVRPYGWLRHIAPEAYPRRFIALDRLPLAITIETSHGAVGIVHAESPDPSWNRATELLERGREVGVTLLGLSGFRETVCHYRSRPVEGLRALVHGHAPVRDVECTANRWNIDTGAGILSLNRLTVLEVNGAEFRSCTFDVDEISETHHAG